MWALALQIEMGPHKDRGKLWPGWDLNPRPSSLTFEFDHRCSTDIILSIFGFSKSIENLQTLEHADNVTNSLAEIALRRWLRCN